MTLADLRADLSQSLSASISEFSTYDNHPADVASETYERSKDMGLQADQEYLLEQIEAALGRIEQGTFGWCINCGRPIPEERLAAVPYTAYCHGCQEVESDRVRQRPQEGLLVNELLRHSFTDNAVNENVGFDGEDSWQAVARYGTSNTPGDFRQVEDYNDVYIDHDEPIGVVWEEDALPISYDRSRDQFMGRVQRKRLEKSPMRPDSPLSTDS
jgi:YteA family regulatory protein